MEHENTFVPFPKMARLRRDILITEKIDGTNAQIVIVPRGTYADGNLFGKPVADCGDFWIYAGSRNRWVTQEDDNFGFAGWVQDNKEELVKLGQGRHFGEWWGRGINRGYGIQDRRFSLFNVSRWSHPDSIKSLPECCDIVPLLYSGPFSTEATDSALRYLEVAGSRAAPGFMNPEGIVVWHTAANVGFKQTLKDDGMPKSLVSNENTSSL